MAVTKKLGYIAKCISFDECSRSDVRSDDDAVIHLISPGEAKNVHSPLKPVLNPTLIGVKDFSKRWENMERDMASMHRDMASMNRDMASMKSFADAQHLVYCAESAKLVVDCLNSKLKQLLGKRLEKVGDDIKEALLNGPFKSLKVYEKESNMRLCGTYGDLVRYEPPAIFSPYLDSVENSLLSDYTSPEEMNFSLVRKEVLALPELLEVRDELSHHILSRMSAVEREIRATVITTFIEEGGLKQYKELGKCIHLIQLGKKILMEEPKKSVPLTLPHVTLPVSKAKPEKPSKQLKQKVEISVRTEAFVPGMLLFVSGPVGWLGNLRFEKSRPMLPKPACDSWVLEADFPFPPDRKQYRCTIVKHDQQRKTYAVGASFDIDPTKEAFKVELPAWDKNEDFIMV